MGAYHQMGHHSQNLLSDPELANYRGAILSPVNYREADVIGQIQTSRAYQEFETVFDPQLYYPSSQRGVLREWAYFPSDVDTADLNSSAWWGRIIDRIATTCEQIEPSAVCSPAVVPRVFNSDYFARLVDVAGSLCTRLSGSDISPIQTALVGFDDLTAPDRALEIGSILSASPCDRMYLVFSGTTHPRRELAEVESIKGAMQLIAALSGSEIDVIVGFCSSDIVLWKAAGASSCATGKFFNLRRFTSSRFEEPSQGGGQLPYWFEESLLAFLRESDLVRIKNRGLLSSASQENPFGERILEQLSSQAGTAWVGLGWRQFMYWFLDFEKRFDRGRVNVQTLLSNSENEWRTLDDAVVLMEERQNDGTWLRAWRRALAEFATS